jgi:hypothetical protein
LDERRRLCQLKLESLWEVIVVLALFRRFWSARLDALERFLDRMDRSMARATRTNRKKKKQRRKT